MCKWMDKVVDGVEVYQVGKQQLWDWCGWTSHGFDSAHSYNNEPVICHAESLRKGVYLVVGGPATFGMFWRPRVLETCTSLKAALDWAAFELAFHNDCLATWTDSRYNLGYDFEIWHVVDDAELWQEWDNASAAYVATHQPLAPQMQPVAIDSRDCDDFYETLYSVYVPMVGQNVSFLVVNRYSCGSWLEEEEYMPCDMQSSQPLSIEDCQWYNWMDYNDLYELWFSEQACLSDETSEQKRIDAQLDAWDYEYDTLESLRQLREAGAIA